MIAAVVVAVLVMMFLAGPIGDFVDRHPTIKMLALSFLILIGVALVGEGLGFHIPKGYIYFAMAFSVAVEMLNIQRAQAPVGAGEAAQEAGRGMRASGCSPTAAAFPFLMSRYRLYSATNSGNRFDRMPTESFLPKMK